MKCRSAVREQQYHKRECLVRKLKEWELLTKQKSQASLFWTWSVWRSVLHESLVKVGDFKRSKFKDNACEGKYSLYGLPESPQTVKLSSSRVATDSARTPWKAIFLTQVWHTHLLMFYRSRSLCSSPLGKKVLDPPCQITVRSFCVLRGFLHCNLQPFPLASVKMKSRQL